MQRIPHAAAQKAPIAALGFRGQCKKCMKGMEKALRPYFELTNVCLGSI